MRDGNRSLRPVGCWLGSVVLLVALATSLSAQAGHTPKRFLTGQLLIEDQGSFFIGGVRKVTSYATAPTPTGTQPAREPRTLVTCPFGGVRSDERI